MGHFDLHCDTLNRCLCEKESLLENGGAISVKRGLGLGAWIQAFAAFIDDEKRGEDAWRNFLDQAAVLQRAMAESDQIVPYDPANLQEGVCNAMLTVENGAALGGKLSRIEEMARMGVKIFSLVWNGENELAGGISSEIGLTDFGREAVKELERCGIVIDVSHLNTLGFWDLCEVAEKPFIASHSNCFEVCPHKRNLDDLQIQEIVRRKGLIGVNFFPVFINGESDASFQDIRAHIRRIIALGGEEVVAVGSDFDGAAMPTRLDRVEKIPDWHQNLYKHFEPAFVEKISFSNAQRFFAQRA